MRKKNKSPVSCIMLWYDGIVFTPLLGRRRTVGGGRRALGGRWAGIHPPPSSSTPTIDDIIERVIWYLRHVDARFPPRPPKLGFVRLSVSLLRARGQLSSFQHLLSTDNRSSSRAAARRRKIWQTGGKTPAFPPLTSHIFTRLPHLL
jgi:hypothetical protein